MRFATGGQTQAEIVSGYTQSAVFPRYAADTLTNGEIYGNISPALNEFGGGINHPSSVGINEIYMPPMREFVRDAIRCVDEPTTITGGVSGAAYIGRVPDRDYAVFGVSAMNRFGETVLDFKATILNGAIEVIKNPAATPQVDVYIDETDMSVFIDNTTASIHQLEYSGAWLNKRQVKLGPIAPRGVKMVNKLL